jgi:CHRD domain/PEP-CTERM motif
MKRILLSVLTACSLMSARADLFQYTLNFSSLGEAQPSPGTGFGTVDYDSTAHTLSLSVNFSGLIGTTTASHIHAATAVAGTGSAGVATTTPSLIGFPLGVSSGSFANVLDLTLPSSYNPSYVTAHGGNTAQAEADLTAAFAAGKAYWNIHSTFSPGGEIRSFLVPVPEPSTLALAGLGVAGMTVRAWNKRRAGKV